VSRALRSLRRSRSVDFDDPPELVALTGHPQHGGTELSGWENPHYRRSGRSSRDTINTEARRATESSGWENPHYRRSGRSPRDTINTEAQMALIHQVVNPAL